MKISEELEVLIHKSVLNNISYSHASLQGGFGDKQASQKTTDKFLEEVNDALIKTDKLISSLRVALPYPS